MFLFLFFFSLFVIPTVAFFLVTRIFLQGVRDRKRERIGDNLGFDYGATSLFNIHTKGKKKNSKNWIFNHDLSFNSIDNYWLRSHQSITCLLICLREIEKKKKSLWVEKDFDDFVMKNMMDWGGGTPHFPFTIFFINLYYLLSTSNTIYYHLQILLSLSFWGVTLLVYTDLRVLGFHLILLQSHQPRSVLPPYYSKDLFVSKENSQIFEIRVFASRQTYLHSLGIPGVRNPYQIWECPTSLHWLPWFIQQNPIYSFFFSLSLPLPLFEWQLLNCLYGWVLKEEHHIDWL